MHILDDPKTYKKLDPNNTVASVDALRIQCEDAWKGMQQVKVPTSFKSAQNICINGMGGSALGGHMIRAVYDGALPVPLDVINSYELPGYVDKNSLVILSSYSGTTEEVLHTRTQALKQKAKTFSISAGGKLGDWAKKNRIPHFIFDDSEGNPSDQPRMGLGYSVFGQLALFEKLGFVKISKAELNALFTEIDRYPKRWGSQVPFAKNPAKKLAKELQGKMLNIVASEHLAGNIHVWANQTNETAKTISDFRSIPELNHHLLEGLRYPAENKKHVHFIFFESALYHKRNQARHKITQRVVKGNNVGFSRVQLKSKTRLGQAMEMLALGSYVTLYQGLLGGVNPAEIPWVDMFKSELKKVK